MPRTKRKYIKRTDESIITASYELIKKKGLEGLNFRTLAESINAHTSIITDKFTRDQLIIEVISLYILNNKDDFDLEGLRDFLSKK